MSRLGMPQRPNPPTATEAPSGMSATASAAELTTLSTANDPSARNLGPDAGPLADRLVGLASLEARGGGGRRRAARAGYHDGLGPGVVGAHHQLHHLTEAVDLLGGRAGRRGEGPRRLV